MNYANLNTHSHFSCGLGIGTSKEIIKKAIEKKLYGLAITDRFTAAGLLDFYKTGKELNFPVALGCELYLIHNNETYRFIVLAKNHDGYTNICKLITNSHLNKELHKKPCVTPFDLAELHTGLFCLSNEIEISQVLADIFEYDFYYEIIFDEEFKEINKDLINKPNIVITSNSFIPSKEYKILQDIMIQNTSFGLSNEIFKDEKVLLSFEEIIKKAFDFDQKISPSILKNAIANTKYIYDECKNIELKFKDQIVNYPHLLHPLNNDSCDKETLLRRIIVNNNRIDLNNPLYKERLEYEIDTIKNNGRVNLIDYFLVLEDMCRWCRANNIAVGPGRGSGAGSLINYGLMVTHLDPIKYGLLFERFISAGRIQKGTLPDVDLDFSEQEPVRQYLIEKYGEDRVTPIGTVQTLKTLGSIKDIFRALYPELDFQSVNKITAAFGKKELDETELEFFERGLQDSAFIQDQFKLYPQVKDLVHRLLGYNRQFGIHACGLAITQDSLKEILPLRYDKNKWVTEYSAGDCETSGIIKYDILGLITLKYIQTCLNLTGITDLYSIPLDDKKTFEAFDKGDTNSVFQFNSDVAKNILRQIHSTSIDILSMVTSVGRPGPMGNNQHNEFIKRANGFKFSTPPHEALKDTLQDTFGIMIYQESVMKASEILGGFSLAEADDIRKAMGKKKASLLTSYKDRFIKYCHKHYPDTTIEYKEDNKTFSSKAEYIWELMATFSGYGFNKSHAMSYALIGYYCQYLKTHYPLQWWTACLEHADDKHLKVFYETASDYCIFPDINNSNNKYEIIGDKIQMPLSCIKGLGPKAMEEIVKCRPFSSFEDFFTRVNKTRVNKATVEKLIFAGCFKSFNKSEQELIDLYYSLRKGKVPEDLKILTSNKIEELMVKSLSFLSINYYKIYDDFFPEGQVLDYETALTTDFKKFDVGGIIKAIEVKKAKNDSQFCNITIENDSEIMKIRFWSDEYIMYKDKINLKAIVKVSVLVNVFNGTRQFIATNLYLKGGK